MACSLCIMFLPNQSVPYFSIVFYSIFKESFRTENATSRGISIIELIIFSLKNSLLDFSIKKQTILMLSHLILQLGWIISSKITGVVVWERVSTPMMSQSISIFEKIVIRTCYSESFSSVKNFGIMSSDIFFLPMWGQIVSKDSAKESTLRMNYFGHRHASRLEFLSRRVKLYLKYHSHLKEEKLQIIWDRWYFLSAALCR